MGLVSEARVDVAVRRVLTSRFELGDFDPKANVPYRSINASIAGARFREKDRGREGRREKLRNASLAASHMVVFFHLCV